MNLSAIYNPAKYRPQGKHAAVQPLICLLFLTLTLLTVPATVQAQVVNHEVRFTESVTYKRPAPPQQRQVEPWQKKDLMEPVELARMIETGAKDQLPLVLSIGPAALIQGSLDMGAAADSAGMAKLKATLADLPANTPVVIYCGCCPFEHCPNIRPAFKLLKEEGFKKARLLNLRQNIRTDWLDKGFPATE